MALRESNPDVYVTGSDEIRVFYHPLTSQNRASLLGVGSAPATTAKENQSEVGGHTHTTNTSRQDTHGQHWMSARAMSAQFFTSLHPCFAQSGTYDGVGKQGLVRHSQLLLRPVHESHHSQYIDRKTRQTLTLPMVPHRTLRWPNSDRTYAVLQKCFIVINVSSISSVRVGVRCVMATFLPWCDYDRH